MPTPPDGTLFVAGRWRPAAGDRQSDVINPFDQSVVAKVAEATATDAGDALAAARQAFDSGDWPRTPARERGALLDRVADLLARDRESIATTETLDTGKTLVESRQDVDDVIAVFRYYSDLADKRPGRLVDAGDPAIRSTIVYEPVGVCVLITPWNYPLLQLSWKIAPALAAGNTVVVKPSEVTPLTTIMLVELLVEAGVPAGVVNLVLGAGGTVGAALVGDPRTDLVSFTGGLATGISIMKAAADNVTKVALELGGKNPNLIFDDTDLETVVDFALTGVFLHAGQVCSAGARVIVQDGIHDAFVAAVADRAARIRLGSGLDPATESGPLVSAAHRAKVERHVAAGLAEGARLVTGGGRPEQPELAGGFFHLPTVFDGCRGDMSIVQDETFGPIMTVERFATEEEAVALGNDTAYGLAGGVWTADPARAEWVASRLRHGTVWINDYGPYLPQAEWGGFGRSGIGRELGPAGLDEYREPKHIWRNTAPRPQRWFAG